MADGKHWDSYYGSTSKVAAPLSPSQFAAFVLSELAGKIVNMVDFGCGNGRDALFFAHHGHQVVGVDASKVAIDSCAERAPANARFMCSSIDAPGLSKQVKQMLDSGEGRETGIYARFFLHAIDGELQAIFLKMCRDVLPVGGKCFFEFRTERDQHQTKVTPDHYRRFISPLDFMRDARIAGFDVAYFVEGFGFAKYRQDDAHVARFVLEAI